VGHARLGLLPKTRKWKELVEKIAGPRLTGDITTTAAGYIDAIAAQTLDASRKALENVAHDSGVRYTFYLLTQVALASLRWLSSPPAKHLPALRDREPPVFSAVAALI